MYDKFHKPLHHGTIVPDDPIHDKVSIPILYQLLDAMCADPIHHMVSNPS